MIRCCFAPSRYHSLCDDTSRATTARPPLEASATVKLSARSPHCSAFRGASLPHPQQPDLSQPIMVKVNSREYDRGSRSVLGSLMG
jgi:hypothetical protein